MTNGRATLTAWLARALVHVQLLAKIAGHAFRIYVVAKRRTAALDRRAQHRLDCAHERRKFFLLQPASDAPRADAGAKKRLARVNVADADDDLAVHDLLLDGDAAAACCTCEVVAVEFIGQRLGRERSEQRMR